MLLQKRRTPLFIILCSVSQVCVLVEGLYQLEVTLFGYNNPTGRCRGCLDDGIRGCCDRFATTNCDRFQCDSFFIYCLRMIGRTGRNCSYFGDQISTINTNDGSLNFSQNTVLGLENPIILPGLTDTYSGVQLHIEIIDDDSHFNDSSNADDLIDVLLIDHDLPIGQPSPRQNHTGVFAFTYVMMDLSITAKCLENFEGSDCSRCLPGFAGTMCDIRINECNCSGHGQCFDGVPSLTCNCDPGFTGEKCEDDIDDCVGVNCSGNGQCVDGINSFSCNCTAGFTGPLCEIGDSEGRPGSTTSTSITFLGGILGAVFSLAFLLILVIALVIFIVLYKKHNVSIGANKEQGIVSPGKSRNTTAVHGDHSKTNISVHYTKTPSPQLQDADEAILFDNPIYGIDGDRDKVKEGTETDPIGQSRLLSTSLPDHEFDNPIYATEETENAYSMITDALMHNNVTDQQTQATYESVHNGQLPNSYRPLMGSAFGQI